MRRLQELQRSMKKGALFVRAFDPVKHWRTHHALGALGRLFIPAGIIRAVARFFMAATAAFLGAVVSRFRGKADLAIERLDNRGTGRRADGDKAGQERKAGEEATKHGCKIRILVSLVHYPRRIYCDALSG